MTSDLTAAITDCLASEFQLTDVTVPWEAPAETAHGDVASPVALQVAKQAGQSPRDIAQQLVAALATVTGVDRAEVAGPGYVNVWLTPAALIESLSAVSTYCDPQPTRTDEPPVIVEYSQPNIAKPLGFHHILSTIIGQVLANLNRHLGYPTVSINHLGDWGTQFGKLAVAMEKWGDKPVEECTIDDLLALYVRFHDEAKDDPGLEDEGRAAFRKLEAGDEDLRAFWRTVVDTTMQEIERTYEQINVAFDHVHGESFYEDKMEPIIEEGKRKGVFVPGEKGALIAEFPESANMPPAVVLKADGATIYHTRDLATVRFRIDEWHPRSILYVVDSAQELYFRQLLSMVEQLGWELPHLEHVIVGRMRFADKSMSTRKGNILKLQDVLDDAVERAQQVVASHGDDIQTDDPEELATVMGRGAVVYGILCQNRRQGIVFDWAKVLSFEGNSAPYVQYTHARARSVLRKAQLEGDVAWPADAPPLSDHERTLMNLLRRFPAVLEEAREAHAPHVLTNWLYALCQAYNSFYNVEPILQADEPQRALRLALTGLTARVIRCAAELLTMRVPDRM